MSTDSPPDDDRMKMTSRSTKKGRRSPGRRSLSRALSGRLLSVANLVGAPVVDARGARAGRLHDLTARWDAEKQNPPVATILVKTGRSVVSLAASAVVLEQNRVSIKPPAVAVTSPAPRPDEFWLARDVLDHQLVDVVGVQVVRAADIYLADLGEGWVVAGVDISIRAFLRRTLRRRRHCPAPVRSIKWSEIQAFVPREVVGDKSAPTGPAAHAGSPVSSVRLAVPSAELRKLRERDVVALLEGLSRSAQAQLTQLADESVVSAALRKLEPGALDALIAELDPEDQAKLLSAVDRSREQ